MPPKSRLHRAPSSAKPGPRVQGTRLLATGLLCDRHWGCDEPLVSPVWNPCLFSSLFFSLSDVSYAATGVPSNLGVLKVHLTPSPSSSSSRHSPSRICPLGSTLSMAPCSSNRESGWLATLQLRALLSTRSTLTPTSTTTTRKMCSLASLGT
jgi:hypothetical protein